MDAMLFAIWAFFFRDFAQKQGLGDMMSIGIAENL
jgi:hypothetical protein